MGCCLCISGNNNERLLRGKGKGRRAGQQGMCTVECFSAYYPIFSRFQKYPRFAGNHYGL